MGTFYATFVTCLLTWITWIYAEDSGCGNAGDIRGPVMEGTLTSHPGYGETMAPGAFCEWVLTPPDGHYVTLTIHEMGNISCHTQLFVYTYLDVNRYPGWNLCPRGYFPLDGVPYHLASARGQWLRVHYRGNKFPEPTTGFSASYSFKEPGCTGNQLLRGDPWWLASHPGAGSWAVEAGSRCTWTLTAGAGQFVALEGGRVDLHCVAGWQSVAVYDGEGPSNTSLIVLLTCTDQVSPLASSGRHIHLSYTDRWASHSLGFNISYRFFSHRQSGCGGDFLLTAPSGRLGSYRLPDSPTYTPLSRCRWRLVAPPGVQLVLRFLSFDVTSRYTEGSCSRDLLVVRQGHQSSASGVHIFCNGKAAPPPLLTPTHPQVEVFFATEGLSTEYGQGAGFTLSYSRTCPHPAAQPTVEWTSDDDNEDGALIITPGERLRFTCVHGFRLASGSTERVCGPDGRLSGQEAVCEAVTCDDIPSPRFTTLETLDLNMDGHEVVTYQDVVNYACVTGYKVLSGDSQRYCQADGTLSGDDLVCGVNRCPAYPVLPRTTVVPIDTLEDGVDVVSFGERVLYSCHHGYREVKGSSVRMCQEDGTYSGQDLVCEARSCSPPPVVPHAHVLHAEDVNGDGPTLSHGELVVYVCDPGYNASTPPIGDYLRACMGGGRLNGTTLLCEPVVCLDPPEVAYTVSSTVDTNQDGLELLTYQEEVLYSCVSGYEPTGGGDNRRMCMHDGGFNGTDLICKLESKIKWQGEHSLMTKPTVIGTAVCLSFFIVFLIILVSLITLRVRRKSPQRPHDLSRACDLKSKSAPLSHHALTLHRVATPWDGTLSAAGGRSGIISPPETLRRPGMGYFRWPMYLWEDPVHYPSTLGGGQKSLTYQGARSHRSDSSAGTALPQAC